MVRSCGVSAGARLIHRADPVFADDLFVIASGRAPERPIFAVRAGVRVATSPLRTTIREAAVLLEPRGARILHADSFDYDGIPYSQS
jgi:hypothetical protein